jgi:hypothetical protein
MTAYQHCRQKEKKKRDRVEGHRILIKINFNSGEANRIAHANAS